ncbi:hypothetical protein Tco_1204652 [Tanacetum coccineum]
MFNPNPDTGIESILNVESTSLVDVPVTLNVEIPPASATTLTPLPLPLILPQQQTPVPTTTNALIPSFQDLPNFGSLFRFDNQLKTLEDSFSEFKQTNQFATALSSILNIVDNYLGSKLKDAVDVAVQLKSDKLKKDAQTENQDFINNLDAHMQKIIKEQVVIKQVSKILLKIKQSVNDQLKAELLTRSSNEAQTSYAVAAKLSEFELKNILMDKIEMNKSIDRSAPQKNLYNALVEAYEADKDILETYEDTVTFKRRWDDHDEDEEPSAGSNWGSKRIRAGKEPELTSTPKEKTSKTTSKSTKGSKSHHKSTGQSTQAEESMHTAEDLEEPTHQEFETGVTEDQPVDETAQPSDCNLAQKEDPHELFDELIDTPLNFLAFVMNRLNVDTLTPKLLAGTTFELMKGTCKSLVELEYFFEEVYKETTEKLDWNNTKGQQYPHDLRKPLPLIPNTRGRQVIPFDHFINNDLAYLCGGVSCRTYATSVTKTKVADYGHIKWIEEESARVVYFRRRIIDVTKLQIESDFKRLRLQDIEDMLILLVQGKLKNLNVEERLAFNVSLRMFTRSIIIQRRVEDLQLGNKDKKNKLMRVDELHKFSDGTFNDVRIALDDRLKGIRMEYLPQTIWRKSEREQAAAMI